MFWYGTPMRITEIAIRAVRGIRSDIRLELNGKSALITGDNGTGKSALVAGILWALQGRDPPTAEAAYSSESSFRRHVLEPVGAPQVSIRFSTGDTITASVAGINGSPRSTAYRDACVQANPVLRRTQLVEFLNDRPSDRFRYFETFLDLSRADEIRESIESQSKEIGQQAQSAAGRVLKLLQDALSNIPFQHRSLDVTWGGVLASLARYAQGLKLAGLQQADWTSLKALADRLAKTVTGNHHTKKRDALKQALHATSQTVAAVKGLPLLEAKKSQVAGLARSLVDSEIAQLLEHAREHLADADRNTCPVCGQSVNREALLASLSVRVDALKQYTTENRELERMRSAWRNVAKPLFDSIAVANAAFGVQSLR